jgi:AraC family transcriptional regulator of adaptative response / DNA-3-methyladenine glycosylase II
MTPSQLREGAKSRRPSGRTPTPGALQLRLPFRRPFAPTSTFEFLAARAVAGVEVGTASGYRRTIALPNGPGVIHLGELDAADVAAAAAGWAAQGWLPCRLELSDLRDLAAAVARCRRLLDLDADARAISDVLGADPALAPMVEATPGQRVPGHVDGFELAVRAVLGQQVSVTGARTVAGRLAATFGTPMHDGADGLTHLFPSAQAIAAADPDQLSLTRARAAALVGLARAVADGVVDLDAGADRDRTSAQLLALPGIGPWTVAYIRMRALGDPDVFMPSDLGVRHGLLALGLPGDVRSAAVIAETWRPWRSYALQHVWAAAARPTERSNSSTGFREEKTA